MRGTLRPLVSRHATWPLLVGPLQELGYTHLEIRCPSQCWRLTGCDPAEPRSASLRVRPRLSCDLAMVSLDPLVCNSQLGDVRPAEG